MPKKIRTVALYLIAYVLVFWVAFRSGEIYQRRTVKVTVETIRPANTYYLVERQNYGNYDKVYFQEMNDAHTVMVFYHNEKLRPLLKLRDIEIYNSNGERLY